MALDIRPLSPDLGAEVIGLDLAQPIDADTAAELRDSLHRWLVITIRGQQPAPQDLIAYARAFGPLEPFFLSDYNLPGHPELYVLSNVRKDGKPIGRDGAGTHWHADSTFVEKPSSVTLLHAVEVPAEGGDTLFVSGYAAYDALDDATRGRIDGRRAIHRYQKQEHLYTAEMDGDPELKAAIEALKARRRAEEEALGPSPTAKAHGQVPEQAHPIARTHPATGRKALFLNEGMMVGIEGMADDEARPLLQHLYDVAFAPERVLRYSWRPGDLVAWDNAASMHCATYTPPDLARTMWRLTVAGDTPF